jgi:hypothetical protein
MFLALYYATPNFSKNKPPRPPRSPWPYVFFLFIFNLARVLATLAVGISFGGAALGVAHFALWFVDSAVVLAAWAHAKRVEI